jgi:uncharacterized LabA/DUF88 family protein
MILFLDEQNVYRGARRAFSQTGAPGMEGNVDPQALGKLLASRRVRGETEDRECTQVRLYTGLPDPTREPRSNAAQMRRLTAWKAAGAWVEARPLRYPRDWSVTNPAQQKGVDVALALDFVMLAFDGAYDVGVIFSSDTDLRPALEFVATRTNCTVETASWWSQTSLNRLSVPSIATWNHRLTFEDYVQVRDRMDYSSR